MSPQPLYIVDSDLFITAKNRYYAFDICPGFWKSIIHEHLLGRVSSIDRVRQELLFGRPEEDLVKWVKNNLPAKFFLETGAPDVVNEFGKVMLWVQRSPQYFDNAKASFATKADGWLVAYAAVHGATIATNEQPAPASRKEVKLPDVCNQFGVQHEDTFAMLKALKVRFEFNG